MGIATMSAAHAEPLEEAMRRFIGKDLSVVVKEFGRPDLTYPTMRCSDKSTCTISRAYQWDFGDLGYAIVLVDAEGVMQAYSGASPDPFRGR